MEITKEFIRLLLQGAHTVPASDGLIKNFPTMYNFNCVEGEKMNNTSVAIFHRKRNDNDF